MITYAQNCEDVLLWRALKNIKQGFYIDIGANEPVNCSVTKWFYDQGWNGINCEPSTEFYKKLCDERPRDINICKGISDNKGKLHFYNIPGTGLSTIDGRIAQMHISAGFKVQETTIDVVTLTDVCQDYVKNKTIHFLKVDVEGAEEQVLRGMDFKNFRPWILVIEATIPNTQKLSISWDDFVKSQGYCFAFFDGLSRYYIANEKKQDLLCYFNEPVNIFDDYIRYPEMLLQNENARFKQDVKALTEDKIAIQHCNEILKKDNEALQNLLNLMRGTISWRITKPLRYVKKLFDR